MPPKNRLSRLPTWISRWLGYRKPTGHPPKPRPLYFIYFWSFIGAFCGLSVVQVVFSLIPYFVARHVPAIVASYGASAVLCYGAIEAPFSQPRALIGGHFISALVGLCITKLFRLLGEARFHDIQLIVVSLCTAVALVAMQVTKTTHPPAGATALLPAVSPEIWILSWYFLPVVLLSSSLVLVSALIINNIGRRYPIFWFTPPAPAKAAPAPPPPPPPPVQQSPDPSVKTDDDLDEEAKLEDNHAFSVPAKPDFQLPVAMYDPGFSKMFYGISGSKDDLNQPVLGQDRWDWNRAEPRDRISSTRPDLGRFQRDQRHNDSRDRGGPLRPISRRSWRDSHRSEPRDRSAQAAARSGRGLWDWHRGNSRDRMSSGRPDSSLYFMGRVP